LVAQARPSGVIWIDDCSPVAEYIFIEGLLFVQVTRSVCPRECGLKIAGNNRRMIHRRGCSPCPSQQDSHVLFPGRSVEIWLGESSTFVIAQSQVHKSAATKNPKESLTDQETLINKCFEMSMFLYKARNPRDKKDLVPGCKCKTAKVDA
jgi:hypothetical protein